MTEKPVRFCIVNTVNDFLIQHFFKNAGTGLVYRHDDI